MTSGKSRHFTNSYAEDTGGSKTDFQSENQNRLSEHGVITKIIPISGSVFDYD